NDHIFIGGAEYIIATAPAANAFDIRPVDPHVTYADAVATNAGLAVGALVVKSAAPPATAKFQSGTVTARNWTITLDAVANLANGDHVSIDAREYVLSGGAGNSFNIAPVNPGGEVGILFAAGTAVRKLRRANTAGADATLAVAGASGLYKDALVEL